MTVANTQEVLIPPTTFTTQAAMRPMFINNFLFEPYTNPFNLHQRFKSNTGKDKAFYSPHTVKMTRYHIPQSFTTNQNFLF